MADKTAVGFWGRQSDITLIAVVVFAVIFHCGCIAIAEVLVVCFGVEDKGESSGPSGSSCRQLSVMAKDLHTERENTTTFLATEGFDEAGIPDSDCLTCSFVFLDVMMSSICYRVCQGFSDVEAASSF